MPMSCSTTEILKTDLFVSQFSVNQDFYQLSILTIMPTNVLKDDKWSQNCLHRKAVENYRGVVVCMKLGTAEILHLLNPCSYEISS